MGRFPLLLLLFFFFLAGPGAAGASVVESAYAPGVVFYTWSDAVREYAVVGGGAVPTATVYCFPDDICTTAEHPEWARDAACEKWSPRLAERLDASLGRLIEAGLPPGLLAGLRVYVLPAYHLALPENPEKPVAGLYSRGRVAVAGLDLFPEYTFLHELGHYLADRVLGAEGYDWIPNVGRKAALLKDYLALRGYPAERLLDASFQTSLPWRERAGEWFAEDFAYWAWWCIEGRRPWEGSYKAACGVPGEEVVAWFNLVFAQCGGASDEGAYR